MMQRWANDVKTEDDRITIMNFFINVSSFFTQSSEFCAMAAFSCEFEFLRVLMIAVQQEVSVLLQHL